ncbi:MAG: hypothetical protein GEU81_13800 [Nitriliruptorales bacterium]|nr:hypothetical protein [Nitriliruptorales bacterium]
MNHIGEADLLVRARRALLDVLGALGDHRNAIVVIGAQAIYLHTGGVAVALAETTKDSDLALDPRILGERPLLEDAMRIAGFKLDSRNSQPGAWISADSIPVDLMVPEALAGVGGRRSARVPPHSKHALRRATGLEAAVADHRPMQVGALASEDTRVHTVNVASPAALLVAKLHKLAERCEQRDRLTDKDAHDIYRLLVGVALDELAAALQRLSADPLAGQVTRQALQFLQRLFADGPDGLGSVMAGRAEQGVGDPDVVSASVTAPCPKTCSRPSKRQRAKRFGCDRGQSTRFACYEWHSSKPLLTPLEHVRGRATGRVPRGATRRNDVQQCHGSP